ncbi:E3 ubiquitin-protein ligase znrf2-like [Oppia nitens]|uniref:E3 ubiquitin-protein ligase znrf2-like n=1 Tax=Oppia nitens TaxID=1686743 RepID=UPI0023DC3C71|nr:E3 ubiquitin-protein ligase znrf2-like [Oppia nitens]
MGAKQSTTTTNASPSHVLQSNGSSNAGHHNHAVATNGRSNSTRVTPSTSHSNANSDIQTSSDWRQRARSLSSVLNASQSNGSAIHVPQMHSSFGLSISPEDDLHNEDLSFGRVFSAHSLPVQLISFNGIKCPVCSKFVLPDDVECHLVMCLTKPRINYNEDMLTEDKGECVICLEELNKGNIIARLPCLCIYHKRCIDAWFEVNRSCPEHPQD